MVCCWRRRRRFDDFDFHARRRNRRHATFTGFCLLTASILFLFVALSLPIIKTVYLLQINGHPSPSQPETSIGTELRFGVWGFCVTRSASHHQVCSPLPPLPPVLFLADVLQFWVASTSSPRSHCPNPVCWTSQLFLVMMANVLVHNSGTPSIQSSSRS